MVYSVNAVYPNRFEVHPAIEKPMLASAVYSIERQKEVQNHKKLHSELAKIGESVRGEHLILK